MLSFEGSRDFRLRLVLSLLSSTPIRISRIRHLSSSPGITQSEVSLLRLIERITNGTKVVISEAGTEITFHPGTIVNGRELEHDCGTERSIGWFLFVLCAVSPFGKRQLEITLRGITNDNMDVSADIFRTVTVPLMKHFGIAQNLELKITARGCRPKGGGAVQFICPNVRQLTPAILTDEGMVKRIRGIAYTARIAPQTSGRMIESARALLNKFIPDVFIYADHYKGNESGLSPGYGISLVAETTTGALISAECCAQRGSGSESQPQPQQQQQPDELTAEDIGSLVSQYILEEISNGGVFDQSQQPLMLLLMAMGPEDVSKVRIGKLSKQAIVTMRYIREFLSVMFKVQPERNSNTIVLTCVGSGFVNTFKKVQ